MSVSRNFSRLRIALSGFRAMAFIIALGIKESEQRFGLLVGVGLAGTVICGDRMAFRGMPSAEHPAFLALISWHFSHTMAVLPRGVCAFNLVQQARRLAAAGCARLAPRLAQAFVDRVHRQAGVPADRPCVMHAQQEAQGLPLLFAQCFVAGWHNARGRRDAGCGPLPITRIPAGMTNPYHPPVKRSVEIAGHKTSISLEPMFWDMLRVAAAAEGTPINALVARVDAERIRVDVPPGLAGAIRLWLVARLRDQLADGVGAS